MMQLRKSEKGQALILIVFAIVGMLALVGLAMDGGQSFSDRRKAQNAVDAAALAESLKYQKNVNLKVSPVMKDVATSAAAAALINGYDGVTHSAVKIEPPDFNSAKGMCPNAKGKPNLDGVDFTVTITSTVSTWFAPVIGVKEVTNTVTATSRSCPYFYKEMFNGNAVVGLNPDPSNCAIDDWGGSDWIIHGGGAFSNGCAKEGNGASVKFDDGECISTVGSESGFSCKDKNGNTIDPASLPKAESYDYPADILPLFPPTPKCDVSAIMTSSGSNNSYSTPSGKEERGSKVVLEKAGTATFAPGVYCIDYPAKPADYSASKLFIYGTEVTFYVMHPDSFELKFAGDGGFYANGRTSGDYAGFLFVIPLSTTPCAAKNCAPHLELRGNGGGDISGTIFAPSAYIDYSANSNSKSVHSQIVGWMVASSGGGQVEVNYKKEENRQLVVYPSLELLK